MNAEIRIWANITGADELTHDIKSLLLGDDDLRALDPDKYRHLIPDFYSVRFTSKAILCALHTAWQLPKGVTRDAQLTILLAVPQGCEVHNMQEHFGVIKKKLTEWAFTNLDDIKNNNYSESLQVLLDELLSKIEVQDVFAQPRIIAGSKGEAVVSYNGNAELTEYLGHLARKEYVDYDAIMFVPDENKGSFGNFTSITVVPQGSPNRCDVYFRAYQSSPIANITSLDDPIVLKCEKPYYKPIELKGSLRDNERNWNVLRADNGVDYEINLHFTPIVKKYKIVLDGPSKSSVSSAMLKPNEGTIQGDVLCLSGGEIASERTIEFSLDDNWVVQTSFEKDETYHVSLEKYEVVDFSTLRSKCPEGATITIYQRKNGNMEALKFDDRKKLITPSSNQRLYFKTLSDLRLKITCNGYEDYDEPLSKAFNGLKTKAPTEIEFVWSKYLGVSEKKQIFVSPCNNDESYNKAPYAVIDRSGTSVSFPADGLEKTYVFSLGGYEDINFERPSKFINKQPVFLDFKKKKDYKWILFVLTGLLLGFLINAAALYGAYRYIKNHPENNIAALLVEKSPEMEVIKLTCDTLRCENDKLNMTIEILKSDTATLGQELRKLSLPKVTTKNQNKVKETNEKLSQEDQNLVNAMKKLCEPDFTQSDWNKAKAAYEKASDKAKEKYKPMLDACEMVLKFCQDTKKISPDDLKIWVTQGIEGKPKFTDLDSNVQIVLRQFVGKEEQYSMYTKLKKSYRSLKDMIDAATSNL